MGLDIRIPIALLFAVLGAMLAAFGAFSNPSLYARSLGINVNLLWGGVLFLFGAILWIAARRGARESRAEHADSGRSAR